MQSTLIPSSRYTSPDWAARERERLWPRVWQLAATIDHLPDPGDWFEFEVGTLSVLIVRDDSGTLRGFQNACRHRGNLVCVGAGSGLTELQCPYHRWTWDLQGRLREVPSRRDFGPLRNADLPLIPVLVDTWGPLVFVNLDLHAEPLAEFLGEIPEVVAWADIARYGCRYDMTVPVACNWKTLIEGFSETYHVQGIHREMLASCDDVNSRNLLYGRHGMLLQPYGIPSPRLRDGASDQEIWDSLMVTQGARFGIDSAAPGPAPVVPPGSTMRDVLETIARERAAGRGWDFSRFDQAQVLDLHQTNLFPNVTAIFLSDALSVVRARPGAGPDEAFMDILNLERLAPGEPRPPRPHRMTLTPEQAKIGLVFEQDIANMARAQRGLHQPGLTHLVISHEEMRIANLHRNLEEWLGEPGSNGSTATAAGT